MKLSPQRMHSILDYALGTVILIGPWLFGFADSFTATTVTLLFGLGVVANAIGMSDSIGRLRIPVAVHMLGDAIAGGLLIASPWICGFAERTWVPQLVLGTILASRAVLFLAGSFISESLRTESTCQPSS